MENNNSAKEENKRQSGEAPIDVYKNIYWTDEVKLRIDGVLCCTFT